MADEAAEPPAKRVKAVTPEDAAADATTASASAPSVGSDDSKAPATAAESAPAKDGDGTNEGGKSAEGAAGAAEEAGESSGDKKEVRDLLARMRRRRSPPATAATAAAERRRHPVASVRRLAISACRRHRRARTPAPAPLLPALTPIFARRSSPLSTGRTQWSSVGTTRSF